MGLAGGDTKRNIEAIALFALFLSFSSFSFINLVTRPITCFPGDVGLVKCPLQPGSHDTTPFGTWLNMPSTSTELMGNQSYRGIVVIQSAVGIAGLQVELVVGCVIPSNTAGARLTLQYANYTTSTRTNSSNFVNAGASGFVAIDNSVGWPCPGAGILSSSLFTIPALNGATAAWIFRVMGSAGGGLGDNPRFSSVEVVLRAAIGSGGYTPVVLSPSTTGFTGNIYSVRQFINSLTVNYNWFAVNSTIGVQTEEGTGSCTFAASSSACTSTITFPTAFLAAPIVLMTMTSNPSGPVEPLGTISLLSAQTLTV